MRTDIQRREVAFDAATGTLVVGARTVVVEPGDNERLLRTYLGLVAEQRDVTLSKGVVLRRDDIAVLADLLDLDDEDLETRLQRILHLSAAEAADLTGRLRRHRVAVAAVGVGLLAGVPAVGTALAGADEADRPVTVPTPTTVAVVQVDPVAPDALDRAVVVEVPAPVAAEQPAPGPAPQPAPEPEPEPEVEPEIGYSVTYERDPSFVAPDGVDIGDSMVIERELPAEG
jgi:hypothetical protein